MKRVVIVFFIPICLLANPWGHRYSTIQDWENGEFNITLGEKINFSVEWGEGDWTNSSLGYGTSNDGTNWTWQDLPWFEDGEGTNKRCSTQVQFESSGTYYYAYRLIKNEETTYQFGSDEWSENANNLQAQNTVKLTVNAIPNPTNVSVIRNSENPNTAMDLSWDASG
ncbi:MAG: hypothetical protein J7K63_01100, partial [Candidatus Marinimicrobia bacterium]|nr:hypothetical protein [Candidatus Neomarinimicrobiota bacterium]